MRTIKAATAPAFARAAADWIDSHLQHKPQSALALPTGHTPLPLYAELVARAQAAKSSLEHAAIFNLDEYCGLSASDPHSYADFLRRHLIAPLRLAAPRVRLLRGDAPDMGAECAAYDASIESCGGIDLCVLGLGVNGHIAFNEPGSCWDLRTHVVELSEATLAAHQRQAATPWRIPRRGVTMGIKTLLGARHILLLMAGAHKQAAKQAFYGGVALREWPVTCLLAHPCVTVIELCAAAESQ